MRPEVTADTITSTQIHVVRKAMLGVPRKNSYHRAILADCRGALDESAPCRESVARAYNKMLGSPAARSCELCDAGFRRVEGIHVGSQRLGMIPDRPCAHVYAEHDRDAPLRHERRFVANVDGARLQNKRGEARRFETEAAAVKAARKAAPRRWHP